MSPHSKTDQSGFKNAGAVVEDARSQISTARNSVSDELAGLKGSWASEASATFTSKAEAWYEKAGRIINGGGGTIGMAQIIEKIGDSSITHARAEEEVSQTVNTGNPVDVINV